MREHMHRIMRRMHANGRCRCSMHGRTDERTDGRMVAHRMHSADQNAHTRIRRNRWTNRTANPTTVHRGAAKARAAITRQEAQQ